MTVVRWMNKPSNGPRLTISSERSSPTAARSTALRKAGAARAWPRAELGVRGVAHPADIDLPNAHGRTELVRDVQLVASDTGRDSPQMEGGKKAPEQSGLSENQGIWREELSQWKIK